MKKIDVRPGDCVVSPPGCRDPRFRRSVIYIWEHGSSGTSGVVLNRPTNHVIGEITSSTPDHIGRHIMYWGGPVHSNLVFMLHTTDWQTSKSNYINDELSVTSDHVMFDCLGKDQPNEWRVFFGHASWAPGQLEGELKGEAPWSPAHSWLILKKPSLDLLFSTETNQLWNEGIKQCSKQSIDAWI
jgi:putative transcriptional regulator